MQPFYNLGGNEVLIRTLFLVVNTLTMIACILYVYWHIALSPAHTLCITHATLGAMQVRVHDVQH